MCLLQSRAATKLCQITALHSRLNYLWELSLGVDVHRADFDFIVVLCVIIAKLSSLLKRIETLISECLCIFIGCIRTIFISLWSGTQSRIGTSDISFAVGPFLCHVARLLYSATQHTTEKKKARACSHYYQKVKKGLQFFLCQCQHRLGALNYSP